MVAVLMIDQVEIDGHDLGIDQSGSLLSCEDRLT